MCIFIIVKRHGWGLARISRGLRAKLTPIFIHNHLHWAGFSQSTHGVRSPVLAKLDLGDTLRSYFIIYHSCQQSRRRGSLLHASPLKTRASTSANSMHNRGVSSGGSLADRPLSLPATVTEFHRQLFKLLFSLSSAANGLVASLSFAAQWTSLFSERAGVTISKRCFMSVDGS